MIRSCQNIDGLENAMGLYPTKLLHAIPHKQEYEYMVTNLCHLMNVFFIQSQVVDKHWAFSTCSGSAEGGQNNLEQSPLRFSGLQFFLLIGSSIESKKHPDDKTVSLNIVWMVVLAYEDL